MRRISFFYEGRIQRNRAVSWRGYPKGAGPPLAHDLAMQGLVCYTFCGRGRRRGLAAGQRKGLSATPRQAGFAGRMTENARACEKQSPPGRQRLCALGWSEAEEKRAQPGRRRYIKTLVFRLSFSHFSQNAPSPKIQKCLISQKPPLPFSANWDSPDRAKSGLRDLQSDVFSSCPIPRD